MALQGVQQETRALGTGGLERRIQRLEPLRGFLRIDAASAMGAALEHRAVAEAIRDERDWS